MEEEFDTASGRVRATETAPPESLLFVAILPIASGIPARQGAIRNVLLKNDQTREAEALSLTDYQAKYYAHELTQGGNRMV